MARAELTPKDIEYKKIIASRLRYLLNQKNAKQIDVYRSTGIPASTLTGYFKGTSLPSPKNVQKIADFFGVNKEDIDPRFEIKSKPIKTVDLNDKNITFVFNGQEISREDMEIIKRFMRGKSND